MGPAATRHLSRAACGATILGVPSTVVSMIATANSWKRQPFGEGVPLRCSLTLSREELERVQAGFVPREMEDKWFIYYEAPYLYLHRSWTGQPVYRVKLVARNDGAFVEEALISKDVAGGGAEHDALLLDFLISNLLLGQRKPFPVPEELAHAASIYQHHISGTAYPEQIVVARAPWWRAPFDAIRRWWRGDK